LTFSIPLVEIQEKVTGNALAIVEMLGNFGQLSSDLAHGSFKGMLQIA
jgi:hypothetical protein